MNWCALPRACESSAHMPMRHEVHININSILQLHWIGLQCSSVSNCAHKGILDCNLRVAEIRGPAGNLASMQAQMNKLQSGLKSSLVYPNARIQKSQALIARPFVVCQAAASSTAQKPKADATERTTLGSSGTTINSSCCCGVCLRWCKYRIRSMRESIAVKLVVSSCDGFSPFRWLACNLHSNANHAE